MLTEFTDTVLLFNKPLRWTSFDVVNKIHYLTRQKIGHAGTLDPLATGLLILCTGRSTKNIVSFQAMDKEYTGTLVLGAITPSFDLETAITERFDISSISENEMMIAAKSFLGTTDQSPPAHSAKHTDGKRYYTLAREGKTFEVKKHTVTLHEFEITRVALPEIEFRIVCGKGFYVRSLVNDFGSALNSGAYLSSLCRTRIGPHHLRDAWEVEEFAKFVSKKKLHGSSP